jgi:hypothetical protein
MNKPRGLLTEAVSRVTGRAPAVPAEQRDQLGYAGPRPRRKNTQKRAMTTWQNPEALKQLKLMAFEMNVSQQELVAEALNLLFAKHKRPTVAQ